MEIPIREIAPPNGHISVTSDPTEQVDILQVPVSTNLGGREGGREEGREGGGEGERQAGREGGREGGLGREGQSKGGDH